MLGVLYMVQSTAARLLAQSLCEACSSVLACVSCEQVIVIVIREYDIPFPDITISLQSAFSWTNLSLFQLFQTGCKVRRLLRCQRWCHCIDISTGMILAPVRTPL